MFDLWRLKRKQRKLIKQTLRELHRSPKITTALFIERADELRLLNAQIQEIYNARLKREADRWDVQLPDDDDTFWEAQKDDDPPFIQEFSPSGRSTLRRLIDEEKTRRREVSAWWWKNILIPAITALTGLAGVITGLIAVIHAKK